MNKEIIDKIKSSKTASDLMEVAKKNGYSLDNDTANFYFDIFHSSGKLADEELNDISGGVCINGKTYSGDPHGMLIVVEGNSCDSYKHEPLFNDEGKCKTCVHSIKPGITRYCKIRTKYKDPYNDKIK